MENRIKDLNNALKADRTRCHRFVANFFRLLENALAYVFMDHLRGSATSPGTKRMPFDTLRLYLIKVGAIVQQSVRRYVVHPPKSYHLAKVFVETAQVLAVPLPA